MILKSQRFLSSHRPSQQTHEIQVHDIDVFVMGDDWTGTFDFLKSYCEVIYLPRTVNISTSKIKADLLKGWNN